VNGRLAPVTATLEDGDVVEIMTACGAYYPGPSRAWLESTKTATAKIQINQWFAGRDGADGAALAKKITEGRLAIGLALRQHERALGDDTPVVTLARRLGYPDADALFVAVTECRLSAEDVAERLIASVDQT
jgi:GTP pyrophosphokinase